jgi:uncharacterized membrane protein YqhA
MNKQIKISIINKHLLYNNMILDKFEKLMRLSRYSILIAVFTSILSSIFLFIWSFREFIYIFISTGHFSGKDIVINIITSMDMFLLGIISLIFAWSIYDIYIRNPNEQCNKNEKVSSSLIVYNLDELKEKLSKIIIIMLIITFFKHALYFEYNTIWELLLFSIAIFFIALGINFTREK